MVGSCASLSWTRGGNAARCAVWYRDIRRVSRSTRHGPSERTQPGRRAEGPPCLSDKESGRIRLDSETTLSDIRPEAWNYKLGNRSALEWILDQYREKTPKDPTFREKFNTYRFADHKEKVINLLARVTTVSVETQAIVEAMRKAPR